MQCVILAGGLGTRLYPRTQTMPKALVEVAGEPFASWQLSWLARQGVTRVVYSIGHLGELIRNFVGDGSRWGISVDYVQDPVPLLGTAGAIRLAIDRGLLDDTFFVLYGDSYLLVPMVEVAAAFDSSGAPALMTVFRNDDHWETSNAVLDGTWVARYEKGGRDRPDDMRYVDYGLSILSTRVIKELVGQARPADLAPVFSELSRRRALAAYETTERFYEVGSTEGIQELEALLLSYKDRDRVR